MGYCHNYATHEPIRVSNSMIQMCASLAPRVEAQARPQGYDAKRREADAATVVLAAR